MSKLQDLYKIYSYKDSDYKILYEIGEEHFISLLKNYSNIRSSIYYPDSKIKYSDGRGIKFNVDDSYFSSAGSIQITFYEQDKTLNILVDLLRNTFSFFYFLSFQDLNTPYLVSTGYIPYDMSEGGHFQLSTVTEYPFSYNFLTELYEFVKHFEELVGVNHNIELRRQVNGITPFQYR